MKSPNKRLLFCFGCSVLLHGALLLSAVNGTAPPTRETPGGSIAVRLVMPESKPVTPTNTTQPAIQTVAVSKLKIPAPIQATPEAVPPQPAPPQPAQEEKSPQQPDTAEAAPAAAPGAFGFPVAISLPWAGMNTRPPEQAHSGESYFRQMTQMREQQLAERQTQNVSHQLYQLLVARLQKAGSKEEGTCRLKTSGNISKLACEPAALEKILHDDAPAIVDSLYALHKADDAVDGFQVLLKNGQPDVLLNRKQEKGAQ